MKTFKTKIFSLLISVFILTLSTHTILAKSPETLTDDEIHERLSNIDSSLQKGEGGSRGWYWTFLGVYTAGTAAQLSLYFAAPSIETDPVKLEYFREDMMTGTITTAIGVLNLALFPMTSMYARNSFSSMTENSHEERVLKLKKAEEMLSTSARWESDNNSLLIHALNFGINLGAGLIIWLAFNRTILDGLITFLPGFAVGEIQILTQPTGAISDWEKYDQKYNRKVAYYDKKNDEDRLWHIAAAPGGLMIVREF